MGALMVEEYFKTHRLKLKTLIQDFETLHKHLLVDFTGSISEFEDTAQLVKQIFTYQELVDRTKFFSAKSGLKG